MAKFKRLLLKAMLILACIALAGLLASVLINQTVKNNTEEDIIYTATERGDINKSAVDEMLEFGADCIIVLGAGIADRETPTPMLKDRLDLGIALYKKGVAPKLLLSGDNGQVEHNEIHVMLSYAKAAGVPESDIFCDHAGFSTYDSMYRAESIFGVKKAVVVTQKYHEYRALYIGKKLGLEVKGAASDQESYSGQSMRDFREFLARNKDFFKVMVRAQAQVGGETIPISGSGVSSHGE